MQSFRAVRSDIHGERLRLEALPQELCNFPFVFNYENAHDVTGKGPVEDM